MTWNPVPDGFLNGILIGYRIKMRMISDAFLDVWGQERHIDVDSETLSYTVSKLPNFATYTFQITAITRYGEGIQSPVRKAKTCPCVKYLTTNWFMLPPYTNRTGDQETGIFPWLLSHMVRECCGNCRNGHGWSEIMYDKDGYGNDGYKRRIPDFKTIINDDTDFHFPIQGHGLLEMYRTFYAYVYAIASPGVAFFIVDDPPDKMPNAMVQTVNGAWGLLLLAVIFSFAAGVGMWALDCRTNELEFPKRFAAGSCEGFWWAFISMTTVGYGDRSPRSVLARLFAIGWILGGLVLTSILMGTITNALTTISFEDATIKLYGTKVAAIHDSPSYRIGLRRNARVNEENKYGDAHEIQRDLLERKVKGALMDGYMAGSYNELFEDEHIRVKEIIDYNSGYGITLGGIHHRLQRCFKNYVKRKRSYIIDYVASQIETVKKNPKSPAEAQSSNLFNPKARVFVLSMTSVLAMFLAAIVVGLCLQFYFKRRFRKKVRDATEATLKNIPKHTSEILESFQERICSLKKELYNKHTNELRAMSGLKRQPAEYHLLPEIQEELENNVKDEHSSYTSIHNNKFTSKTFLVTSPNIELPGQDDVMRFDDNDVIFESDDVTPFDDIMALNNSDGSSFRGFFTQDSLEESLNCQIAIGSPAMQSRIQLKLRSSRDRPTIETRPEIKDLQREAYVAGLKTDKVEGNDESAHPFSKMYRYLWVEK